MRLCKFLKVFFLIYLSLNMGESRFQSWRRNSKFGEKANPPSEDRDSAAKELSQYLDFAIDIIKPIAQSESKKLKSHQSDKFSTLGTVFDGITGALGSETVQKAVLQGVSKISESLGSMVKSLGPFLGFAGPLLTFISMFLGDPVDQKLDLIIEKLDTLQEAMLSGFNRIENLIKAQDCRRTLKPAIDDITLAFGNLEDILVSSRTDPLLKNDIERRDDFLIRVSKLGSKKENIERALAAIQSVFIVDSFSTCKLIEMISDGTDFTNGIKGSADSLFKISSLLLSKMEEGITFLVAYDEAVDRDVQLQRSRNSAWVSNTQKKKDRRRFYLRKFKIYLESPTPTPTPDKPLPNLAIYCSIRANTLSIPCTLDAAVKRLENPTVFAQNMRLNLKKIWEDLETSKSVPDDAWNGANVSPAIQKALEPYFPEKELACFTYEDGTTEGNYFTFQSRPELDIRYKTRDTSASVYRSKQYVITLIFTPTYEILASDPNNVDDYKCLTTIFEGLRDSFSKGYWGRADRFITSSYFRNVNARHCKGRLGGIFLHFEPPAQSNIIHSSVVEPCMTSRVGSPRPNQACSFPFRYQNVDHWQCTNLGTTRPWCSVRTTSPNNDHVSGQWGYCPDACGGKCLSNDPNFCLMNNKLFHIYWLSANRRAENWRWRGYVWVSGTE